MRISEEELEQTIIRILMENGASLPQAENTAWHMSWCERVGRHNFGIERVPIHVKRMKAGVLNGKANVTVSKLTPSLARIDGGGGFGYCAASRAMRTSIEMAKKTGIGAAAVKNSNFFGAGAFYVNFAANEGMIGIAMSNSFPKVVAHGGLQPVLGTNPFAFGAPRPKGLNFLFDMATSALAGSTVREHVENGQVMPEGLAIDAEGRPITDPAKVSEGALLPFGGPKGFGLSLMVEILAGVITGSGVGAGVASMYNDFSRGGDNGHFMLALNIKRFMTLEDYVLRFEGLMAMLKSSGGTVRLPGEAGWEKLFDARANGVEVDDDKWAALVALSASK